MRSGIFAILVLAAAISGLGAGSPDPTFNGNGSVSVSFGSGLEFVQDIAVQQDGRIVAVGYSLNGGNYDFAVVRLNADGSLDPTFDGDGKLLAAFGNGNDYARAVAIQPDGKIVVAGSSSNGVFFDFALARFDANGASDRSFGVDGKVRTQVGLAFSYIFDIAIGFDGKIVAAGEAFGDEKDAAIVRYNEDGSLDSSFASGGIFLGALQTGTDDSAFSIRIQPDGKIVFGGMTGAGSGAGLNLVDSDIAIVRLNRNGSYDNSFDQDGKVFPSFGTASEAADELLLHKNGAIVFSGRIGEFGGSGVVARLKPDGSSDNTFDSDGNRQFNSQNVGGVTLQADGKLLVAYRGGIFPDWNYSITRLTPGGSVDDAFGTSGTAGTAFCGALSMQPDGRILMVSTQSDEFRIARFTGDTPIPATLSVSGQILDGNGRPAAFAKISFADQTTGSIRVVSSNQSGFFRLRGLASNEIYNLRAASKRSGFPVYRILLRDDIEGLKVFAD